MARRTDYPPEVTAVLDACLAYHTAKVALETHEGKAAGAEYALKLGQWRGATSALTAAARAYSESQTRTKECAPQS